MMGFVDSPVSLALAITIGVLPAFGITMFLLGSLAGRSPALAQLTHVRAPWLYSAFLAAATVAAVAMGLFDAGAALRPDGTRGVLLALILVPPAALVPYFVELALDARGPGAAMGATGVGENARASVVALVTHHREWWVLAVATALLEEVLFRGVLLPTIAAGDATGLTAVAVSGLVFGAHHVAFGLPGIAGKTVAGLAWGGLMLLAGTLLVPVLAHLTFQCLVWRRGVRTAGAVS